MADLKAKAAGMDEGRLERISEHLERSYVGPGKIAGCQTVVARHGQVAYFKSQGMMERERRTPMRDDAIFRIYSMTKPITSVALMTLFERGYFQLNDPLHKFIPEWRDLRVYESGEGEQMVTRAPQQAPTFRHILSHTAGFSYGLTGHPTDSGYGSPDAGRGRRTETLRSFIERLAHVALRYEPSERWMYSYSTDICGYLVEAISGKPFDEYLREVIFEPLRMVDTAFCVAPEKQERFAANYGRGPDKRLQLIDDPEQSPYLKAPTFLSGGAGLTGTTADYLRFCEMLRRGGELDGARILGRPTIELMTRNHLPNNGDLSALAMGAFSETPYSGIGFGLGFAMTLDPVASGSPSEGDYYWGGAASTIFWVDPKEDLVAIFMTQLMPSTTFNFRGQLKNIIYSAIVD
jgi:CubicO group peptidase (beta-lactamase class C family)